MGAVIRGAKSFKDNTIHYVAATDMTGSRACYFVQVQTVKLPLFMKAVQSDFIRFSDYGKIIASCYGEMPTAAIRQDLLENYGFECV